MVCSAVCQEIAGGLAERAAYITYRTAEGQTGGRAATVLQRSLAPFVLLTLFFFSYPCTKRRAARSGFMFAWLAGVGWGFRDRGGRHGTARYGVADGRLDKTPRGSETFPFLEREAHGASRRSFTPSVEVTRATRDGGHTTQLGVDSVQIGGLGLGHGWFGLEEGDDGYLHCMAGWSERKWDWWDTWLLFRFPSSYAFHSMLLGLVIYGGCIWLGR